MRIKILKKILGQKNIKKTNEEIIKEINDKIRQLYTDINKDLAQKINKNDLDIILSENNLKINNNNETRKCRKS